jgi:hypothetical protein
MRKLVKHKYQALNQKTQISFSVFICLLSLISAAFWGLYSYSPITLQSASELILDSAPVDANALNKLESTIYFVRQSYFAIPALGHQAAYIGYLICLITSTVLLILGLKRWANINLSFIIGGCLIYLLIIFWTNQFANWKVIGLVIMDQLQILGILIVYLVGLFISAAIPRLLFQLGYSQNLSQSKRNWIYFLIIYLANLILAYGKQFLSWDLNMAIPGIILALLAWIAYAFQASSLNTPLKWGLSVGAFSTLIIFQITGNDPGISAFEHWILISQILMTAVFPLFILTNFKVPIQQNMPVFKIVHKAPHLDLRIMYVGVAILGSAWIFAKNGSVMHQFQAAFHNERGDISILLNNKQDAEFAYQQAMLHSKLNAKSNISLAAMALDVNDVEAAAYYLHTSQVKHANPITYIALAHIYQQAGKTFESLFTLQQAQRVFPSSAELNTQLAKQFETVQAKDSANYYYQLAYQNEPNNPIGQGNLLYITKKSNQELAESEDPAVQANLIAIALKNGDKSTGIIPPANSDPGNDLRIWSYLYNYNMLNKGQAPELPKKWEKDPAVLQIFPEIKLLIAWQDFYHNKPLQALQKINLQISNDTTSKTEGLQNILAFWKQSLLETKTISPITGLQEAKKTLQQHPFQVDALQKALPILNKNKLEKLGYDAALAALQWNEDIPVYYLIYAMQAYQLGEIAYGEEATKQLKVLDVSTYQANQKILDEALLQAQQRQKFN